MDEYSLIDYPIYQYDKGYNLFMSTVCVRCVPGGNVIDSERIDRIMTKFTKVWKEQPDSRFTQLICNFLIREYYLPKSDDNYLKDPFYMEDDLIEDRLDNLLNKVQNNEEIE